MQKKLNITPSSKLASNLGKSFWVIWNIELWERFGYYGVQGILALYFVKQLGYSESQSFYVFGSFTAFVYGFVWLGGWVGDKYLGTKRTLVLGTIILMFSYAGLALANSQTIFYALAGIIVGNTLFKANPTSLISKIYEKGDTAIDGAMTYYYMAINIGSMISMAITPIIAQRYGWTSAFWLCAVGLFWGLSNYFIFRRFLNNIVISIEQKPLPICRILLIVISCVIAIFLIGQLLNHTKLCNYIVYTVVTGGFLYFLKIAFSLKGISRTKMLVAFVLILQAVVFFVLYNQMPTSLTFFAAHNVNNVFFGWEIPPAEYQVLNPIIIVCMSPLFAWIYCKFPSTHVTKFCIGMTLCAGAFLVISLPQYISINGMASPYWMLLTYFLQSTGELLISGLGLAMVAELCPSERSGFVMGVWFLGNMLAGPIGAWVGAMTTHSSNIEHISTIASMNFYGNIFFKIGIATSIAAVLMWLMRPTLNRVLNKKTTIC